VNHRFTSILLASLVVCFSTTNIGCSAADKTQWDKYNDAGTAAYNQGQYAQAEPLYKRSLQIKEKALGPDHPDLATGLENYAKLLRKTNRDAEAVKLDVRAKAIRAKPR